MIREKPELKTMETLLMRRLEKLFEAMDDSCGPLVDEIIDEMEMLFKLKPPIYNEIIEMKEQLLTQVEAATKEVARLADMTRDDIQRRRFLENEVNSIDWEYRKDYLESIIEIMGKYQMIPYLQQDVTEMQSQYEIPYIENQEQIPEPPQQPPVQQEQQPQQLEPQQLEPQPQEPQQPPVQQQSQPLSSEYIQQQAIELQKQYEEIKKNEPQPPSPIPVKTEEKTKKKRPYLSRHSH